MQKETREKAIDAVLRQIFTGDHGHVKRVYVICDPDGVQKESICYSKAASVRYVEYMEFLYGRQFKIEQVTYEEACAERGITEREFVDATICCEWDEIIVREGTKGFAVYTMKDDGKHKMVKHSTTESIKESKTNKTKKGTKK